MFDVHKFLFRLNPAAYITKHLKPISDFPMFPLRSRLNVVLLGVDNGPRGGGKPRLPSANKSRDRLPATQETMAAKA